MEGPRIDTTVVKGFWQDQCYRNRQGVPESGQQNSLGDQTTHELACETVTYIEHNEKTKKKTKKQLCPSHLWTPVDFLFVFLCFLEGFCNF